MSDEAVDLAQALADAASPRLPVVFNREPLALVDPETGEAHALTEADLGVIARWRLRVGELEGMLKAAKRVVDAEVLRRMDTAGEWTMRAGELELNAPSPRAGKATEWERVEELRDELVFLGVAQDLVDAAFEPVTDHKPRARGIDRLRKLARDDVNEALDRHAVDVDKTRRVTVKGGKA